MNRDPYLSKLYVKRKVFPCCSCGVKMVSIHLIVSEYLKGNGFSQRFGVCRKVRCDSINGNMVRYDRESVSSPSGN